MPTPLQRSLYKSTLKSTDLPGNLKMNICTIRLRYEKNLTYAISKRMIVGPEDPRWTQQCLYINFYLQNVILCLKNLTLLMTQCTFAKNIVTYGQLKRILREPIKNKLQFRHTSLLLCYNYKMGT